MKDESDIGGTRSIARQQVVIGVVACVLILLPKINIVQIAGQTAGLRIDDLAIVVVWYFMAMQLLSGRRGAVGFHGYVEYIAYAFVGTFIAALLGWPPHLLYPARLLEYMSFAYLGVVYARNFSIESFIWIVSGLNMVVMVLQFLGVLGGFTASGYQDVGRVVGLTAGPWEIGYLLNVFYVVLASLRRGSTARFIGISALFLFAILLTGSRSAAFVFLVTAIALQMRNVAFHVVVLRIVGLALAIGLLLAVAGNQVLSRSRDIFSPANLDYVSNFYGSLPVQGSFDYADFETVSEVQDTDRSWVIRSTHWMIAVREFSASPILMLVGVGAGTFGPALDGAWTRILTETGLIGLCLYVAFVVRATRLMPGGRLVLFATVVNMAFIDIHLSYKSMAVFLFLMGYFHHRPFWERGVSRPGLTASQTQASLA